ncbi:hypothetical protein JHFBIEKO_2960 [Methylobacterium mesophilicum]|nr:hypothetical protein JHFBIEKO_2960 [Methylobacterium mesophilicum]
MFLAAVNDLAESTGRLRLRWNVIDHATAVHTEPRRGALQC